MDRDSADNTAPGTLTITIWPIFLRRSRPRVILAASSDRRGAQVNNARSDKTHAARSTAGTLPAFPWLSAAMQDTGDESADEFNQIFTPHGKAI
jgi:hypothetical protein